MLKVFGLGHEASHYYSMLLRCSDKSASALRVVWESDLATAFTEEEWKLLLRNFKKMSRDLKTRLIQFKVHLRYSPLCWRCQGGEGTLMHMLWDCPRIQEFWLRISAQIEHIQRHNISFSS